MNIPLELALQLHERAAVLFMGQRVEVDVRAVHQYQAALGMPGRDCGLKFVDVKRAEEFLLALAGAAKRPRPTSELFEVIDRSGDDLFEHLMLAFGKSQPFHNIVRRLADVGCNCVVVDGGYREPAWHDGFIHRRYRRATQDVRLHFFSQRGSTPRYFGAIALRRMPTAPNALVVGHVGLSMLEWPEQPPDSWPYGVLATGEQYFCMGVKQRIVCQGQISHVVGVPFQQQSGAQGTCGNAALVMATRFLKRAMGSREFAEEQITNTYSGAKASSLAEDDIARSFVAAGLAVRCYTRRGAWQGNPGFRPLAEVYDHEAADLVHLAVDSCLPAILIVDCRKSLGEQGRHALVVVGHTAIAPDQVASTEAGAPGVMASAGGEDSNEEVCSRGFRTTTDWVRDFLVHDDAVGPYLRVPMRLDSEGSNGEVHSSNRELYRVPDEPRRSSPSAAECGQSWERGVPESIGTIIMPLPADVSLDPLLVHKYAFLYVTRLLANEPWKLMPEFEGKVWTHTEKLVRLGGKIVIGAYLDNANRARAAMVAAAEEHSEEEAILVSSIQLPKYVYVVSVLEEDEIRQKGTIESDALGYLLLDATATHASTNIVLLAKLGEWVQYHDPATGTLSNAHIRFARMRQVGVTSGERQEQRSDRKSGRIA